MIITNNSQSQSLRIIPRESNILYTSESFPKPLDPDSLYISLTEDGTGQTASSTNTSSTRYDNYLELNFEQYDSFFREGYYYNIEVCTNDVNLNLVYRDRLFVLPASQSPYDSTERYTINPNVPHFESAESSDEYIIFDEDSSYNYNTDSSEYASQSDSASGGGTVVPEGTNYDTDNDGYGEVYNYLGTNYVYGVGTGPLHGQNGLDGLPISPTVRSNIIGEYTVDESQYGTFQTASGYTGYVVHSIMSLQPSNITQGSYYNQSGFADYTNGYVRYSEGYDYDVAKIGYGHEVLNIPVDSTNDVSDLMSDNNIFSPANDNDLTKYYNVQIFLDSSKTDIAVGDSIYSDNQGTKFADGTTNGRKNRHWFNWNGDVVKVTAGVVTHRYNYKDGAERYIEYRDVRVLNKRSETAPTQTHTLPEFGKEWQGDEATGSLVVVKTIDEVKTELQGKLDDDFAMDSPNTSTYLQDKSKFLDWGSYVSGQTTGYPFESGNYFYKRKLGKNINRRIDYDMGIPTEDLIFTITGPSGTTETVDISYKSGETLFAYLPIFQTMTSALSFPEGKGFILIEYNRYTIEIINHRIVFKSNY